jgi:hypothetical protein
MYSNLNPRELNLLKYLRDHSGRPGQRVALDPKPITRGLRISMIELAEASAALAARGLAGVRNQRPDANDVPSGKCTAIWLTGKGEDFLKLPQS